MMIGVPEGVGPITILNTSTEYGIRHSLSAFPAARAGLPWLATWAACFGHANNIGI